MLELDMSALAFMMKCFPEIKEVEDMRKSIGRYGLTGKQQVGKHDVYIADEKHDVYILIFTISQFLIESVERRNM